MEDFKNRIENYMILCDFYSSNVQLKINNKATFSTLIGGLISILSAGIVLFFAWEFGNDIIYKMNPTLIVINGIRDYLPEYNFNYNNSFIAFRVEDYNGNAIPFVERYFDVLTFYEIDVKVDAQTQNNGLNYIQTLYEINSSDCHFYNKTQFKGFFPDAELGRLSCFENLNYNLSGVWGNTLKFLHINVRYCRNSTENNNHCFPIETIKSMTGGNFFSFYYSDSVINSKDYLNPVKYINKNSYTFVDPLLYKYAELYYKATNIITDNGFFTESVHNLTFTSPHKFNADVGGSVNQDYLIQLNFYFSLAYDEYSRSYIKVQTVFANLGGIIQVLALIGRYVLHPLNDKMINSILINQLFDVNLDPKMTNSLKNFDKIKSGKFDHMKDKSSVIEENNTVFNLKLNNNMTPGDLSKKYNQTNDNLNLKTLNNYENDVLKTNLNVDENFKKKMTNFLKSFRSIRKFEYGWWELVVSVLCRKDCKNEKVRKKDKIYKMCVDEVNKYLNLNYLFEKIQEIDWLKYLLLKREQILSFHLFQKPEFMINKESEISDFSIINIDSKEINETKLLEIINYFSKLSKENLSGSTMEAKTLSLLNNELKSLIKSYLN